MLGLKRASGVSPGFTFNLFLKSLGKLPSVFPLDRLSFGILIPVVERGEFEGCSDCAMVRPERESCDCAVPNSGRQDCGCCG